MVCFCRVLLRGRCRRGDVKACCRCTGRVNQGIIGCMNEVEQVLLSEQSVPKIQINGKFASKMPKKAVWICNEESGRASGGDGAECLKQERLP